MELRKSLRSEEDLAVLWVMSSIQINERTLRFVDELGLGRRMRFLADPGSRTISELGLLVEDPEPLEIGVPHPTTYLIDARGVLRFADVREDYHVWLDPERILREVAALR